MKIAKSLVLAAGLSAAGGASAEGHIYEIFPCDEVGNFAAPYATIDKPLTSGENLFFKVRLINQQTTPTSTDEEKQKSTWYLKYNGLGVPEVEELVNPLQIGIYVSGQLRYATLLSCEDHADTGFTDLIFNYKTMAGDFALPIVLANAEGAASESQEAKAYLLNSRNNKWEIANQNGDAFQFYFWTGGRPVTPPEADGTRHSDYSLAQAGFYVQSVDFSSEWEADGDIWRSVHEGSTMTVGSTPSLVVCAPADNAVTLHVWSEDETAVRIKGGVKRTVTYFDAATQAKVDKEVVMGDITIAGGQVSANFLIEGVSQTGGKNGDGKTRLVLSQWQNYRYNSSTGALMEEYVTVPVVCIEPLPTTIRIERDDATVYAQTAGDDKYLTAVTRLAIYATQAPEAEVNVTVKTAFQVDGTKDNWGDYVRFSTDNTIETLPAAVDPVITLTPTDYRKYIYVYALRAESAYTIGTGKQVQFNPEVDPAEMTAAKITGLQSTGININANAPVITAPIGGDDPIYTVTAGESLEIPVAVNDTYADMTDTATGYKVRIKASGTSASVTLPVNYTASGEGGLLESMTTEKASPSVTYPTTPGVVTTTVEVYSPIRKLWSEAASFKVTVAPARTSKAEITDESSEYN